MVSCAYGVQGNVENYLVNIHSPYIAFRVIDFAPFPQVLLSICSLLCDPNPDDPLVPEIARFALIFSMYGDPSHFQAVQE